MVRTLVGIGRSLAMTLMKTAQFFLCRLRRPELRAPYGSSDPLHGIRAGVVRNVRDILRIKCKVLKMIAQVW